MNVETSPLSKKGRQKTERREAMLDKQALSRFFLYNINRSYPGIVPGNIKGLLMYPIRKLLSTTHSDVIWLPSAFANMETSVFAHLNNAGIYPTRGIVYADDWSEVDLDAYPDHCLRPFIMNEEMAHFTGLWDWYHAVMAFERKRLFAKRCLELGLPIAQTYFAEDIDGLTDDDFARGLYAKPDYGASGVGSRRVYSRQEFETWRAEHPDEDFILQEPFPKVAEFSVQLDLTNEPRIVDIVGQHIGDANDHEGNFGRVDLAKVLRVNMDVLKRDALRLAWVMKQEGIRHRCGLDLMVDVPGNYVLGEANARDTGATFAIDAAHAIGAKSWSYKNVLTTARSVDDLNLAGDNPLFYRPGRDSGIVIVNAGPISYGKLSVMVVGRPEEWSQLEHEYRSWLQCDHAEAEIKGETQVAAE